MLYFKNTFCILTHSLFLRHPNISVFDLNISLTVSPASADLPNMQHSPVTADTLSLYISQWSITVFTTSPSTPSPPPPHFSYKKASSAQTESLGRQSKCGKLNSCMSMVFKLLFHLCSWNYDGFSRWIHGTDCSRPLCWQLLFTFMLTGIITVDQLT